MNSRAATNFKAAILAGRRAPSCGFQTRPNPGVSTKDTTRLRLAALHRNALESEGLDATRARRRCEQTI
jgi:hypothetical protein